MQTGAYQFCGADDQTEVMTRSQLVATSAGPVEVVRIPGPRPPVLFFPGGHCSAHCDCGWSLYTEAGHGVIACSRPGYGRTCVGSLGAEEFALLVNEVCRRLGVRVIAAAVGVSFGGLQAVHVAGRRELAVRRLVLHSAAPSVLPYPDSRVEAIFGPVVFSPLLQGQVWRLIRRVVRSEAGLRRMMGRLSTLPVESWWHELSSEDKDEARGLFQSMHSDSGFAIDLRQGHPSRAGVRRAAMSNVPCPALVTGTPHDRGVSFAHAENFASTIPDAVLLELDSPSHLFWLGRERMRLVSALASFLGG
jgi:pimeloyl-ACP methyl ester carboxylesterase